MIILPLGLTSEEIRVLQEFRRVGVDTMAVETIKALKHPVGPAGDAPAISLRAKGWLTADASGESFVLTSKAKDFLAVDVRPMFEEGPAPGQAAASDADATSADEA